MFPVRGEEKIWLWLEWNPDRSAQDTNFTNRATSTLVIIIIINVIII
jgi:hypothetical protein